MCNTESPTQSSYHRNSLPKMFIVKQVQIRNDMIYKLRRKIIHHRKKQNDGRSMYFFYISNKTCKESGCISYSEVAEEISRGLKERS